MAEIKKGLGPDHIVDDVDLSTYATKTELNNGLAGKQDKGNYAASSHGSHVPGSGTTNKLLRGNGSNGSQWSAAGTTSQYMRGDGTWQTKNWIPSSGGKFTGAVHTTGSPTHFYYDNATTSWSNANLCSVMTIIQKYGAPSSRVLKSDIVPLSADAFDKINPVSYTFKDDARVHETDRGKQRFGFIAEEVRDAGVPTETWVFEEDQGEKDENGEVVTTALPEVTLLKPIDLTAVLWAKVQELEQRINELEGNAP